VPTFITPGPVAATVEVAGARVRITATDRADTVVQVEPVNPASRSDVKVADRTKVDFADGRLSVKTTTAGDKSGSVAITIELPSGSGLALSLAHSSVQADGPVGRCELRLASGQVELDRIGALQANIASGEVAIGHLGGTASIEGAAFGMRIGEAAGAVGLTSSGGSTWIGHARADVELSSAAGDLDIDQADGSVTATTASGAIRIGRLLHGQARLKNGSGNIEVGIGGSAAASVDASSERGAVHDFVSSAGQPGSSDDKVMVHARTRNGDIVIQRAAG
jgi:Putative adhesin